MFFSFDGLDGVGKTTQSKLFCDWLASLGHRVLTCQDPGSTELGETLRAILLQGKSPRGLRAEMLLFMAARAQLVEEVIRPALLSGQVVVSDRFLLANVVYQGYAGGLPVDALWKIGRIATAGLEPDLTILLDMPPDAAQKRIGRELDRMEQQDAAYQTRLRQGYLAEAARQPDKIALLDASRPIEEIQADIRRRAEKLLSG